MALAQIYGISTYDEAVACMQAGADLIGIVPPQPTDSPIDGLPEETVRRIVEDLRGKCKVILLSESNDPDYFVQIAAHYQPDVIHLAGKSLEADNFFRRRVKEVSPDTAIMQCVPVGSDLSAVKLAVRRAQYADYIILDSIRTDGGVGASGTTHSWEVDAAIVQAVSIPVVMAGGLGPDNVCDAIKAVHPAVVDTLTKTNKKLSDGTMIKDIEKVADFVRKAHSL